MHNFKIKSNAKIHDEENIRILNKGRVNIIDFFFVPGFEMAHHGIPERPEFLAINGKSRGISNASKTISRT